MTGTLTILGADRRTIEWDTDKPVSIEEAREAYRTALGTGMTPLDTTSAEGAVAVSRTMGPGALGTEQMPTDVTMMPRFAGGC